MTRALERLLRGEDLTEESASALLARLVSEPVEPALAGALLAALRSKGVTPFELRGFARTMVDLAQHVSFGPGPPIVDVAGTGGDGAGTLNLSTGTALLAAACGLRVAKHGNRAVSSRCGSADVLEALGIPFPTDPGEAAACLDRTGFAFLFAPHFHPAMKALAPVRRALGVRTVFNLLGPLINPAEPPFLMAGAHSPEAAETIAAALCAMRIERAFVVHGDPGWDEPTPVGRFLLLDVRPGRISRTQEDPLDYGVPRRQPHELAGGDAPANAEALRRTLCGETGAHRDALLLGAALLLILTGIESDRRSAAARAAAILDGGRAAALLDRLGVPRSTPREARGAAHG